MPFPVARKVLDGWGRFCPRPCDVARPEDQDNLLAWLDDAARRPFLARGLGRSYGDAAVLDAGTVLDMTRLNRMLGFDPGTGVLECEGGVSFAEILDVFLPRGFLLPVTPGTRFVTVAGAVAQDVHGKNHHRDGTLSRHVASLRLWTPAHGLRTCSPEEHPDLFWATVGGAGLTGIILSVRLRLRPVESAYVRADIQRCSHLDQALEAMAASDRDYRYSVAWIDGLASGRSLGRSVLMRANDAGRADLPSQLADAPYRLPRRRPVTVPFDFPGWLLAPRNLRLFNAWFYARNRDRRAALVDVGEYFYPLDRIDRWNRMYGKRGFIQYQALFPFTERAGLVRMLETLAREQRASFLAVLKCFGDAGPGLLSYPMPGYTLALDLPNRPGLEAFTRALDRILLDHGGRLYLAKDAVTEPATWAAMYPKREAFLAIRRDVDPRGILRSNLSRRLRLDPDAEEP